MKRLGYLVKLKLYTRQIDKFSCLEFCLNKEKLHSLDTTFNERVRKILLQFNKIKNPFSVQATTYNQGCTLVELMIAFAILGILASITIPNLRRYQAKAKTAEAKYQLSALYAAETSAFAEYGTYVSCLKTIGYNPSSDSKSRYYAVGFLTYADDANQIAKDNGAPSTCANNNYVYPAGKRVTGNEPPLRSTDGLVSNHGNSYTAEAVGRITPNTAASFTDRWQINEDKELVHIQAGY